MNSTNRLLYRLLCKIACKNNLTQEELFCWWEKAKEADTINYRHTLMAVSEKHTELHKCD